jgi:hypothetical protein
MDATTKKLLKRLRELETDKWRIDKELQSIQTALSVAGAKPGDMWFPAEHETLYAATRPFAHMSLADSCEKILKDYQGRWLTKSQVEYLLARGGYESQAKDSKNSIDVTLRRLAGVGKCQAERVRGSHGNKYRVPTPNENLT